MKTKTTLVALFLGAQLVGCSMFGGGQPAAAPEEEEGKPTPEALAALEKVQTQNLQQCEKQTADAEAKLTTFLDKVSGKGNDAMGQPLKPMSEIVAKLKEEKVTVTVENKGTPENPILMVQDSFMAEGQKLAGAPPAKMQAYAKRAQVVNPLTSGLRDQVSASNAAFMTAFMALNGCMMNAKGFTSTLAGLKNGGHEATPAIYALYGKALEANLRSQTVLSSATAIVTVLQASLNGKGDVKVLDAIAEATRKSIAEPQKVTEEQAKQSYEMAAKELTQGCEQALRDYYAKHPELGEADVSSCSGEGLKRGKPKAPASEEGGFFDTLLTIIPNGHMIKAAVASVEAMGKGDYAGALKGAASLVPAGSPLGQALSTAGSIAG